MIASLTVSAAALVLAAGVAARSFPLQAPAQESNVSVGDPITEESAKRIREAAYTVGEHFRVGFRGDGKRGIVLMIVAP